MELMGLAGGLWTGRICSVGERGSYAWGSGKGICMYNRQLFILAHEIGCSRFYPDYQRFVKNQWKPYKELKEEQDKQLRHMISFCNKNVPYYRDLFKSLKLQPSDIRVAEDLEKLPVLTKDIIKHNWEDLKPANLSGMKYYEQASGGSTGKPLSYRLSKHDRFLSGALLYRGWGYGGYELGDRMVLLAGSSLAVGTKSRLNTFIHEAARNLRKLSSYDLGENEMREYVQTINSFKPKSIRGYASSIFFFAKWIEENDLTIHSPDAVFTTAEKLYPHMRSKISEVFGCEVYDGYGLNDGGVSAYECPEHTGLHIDTERSIMEGVDERGQQVDRGMGQILATSLHNYALPFIRYDTGDVGSYLDETCACGRGHRLLKEVIGRDKEFLITPMGKYVHGAAFFNTVLNGILHANEILEFQVIQETKDDIRIDLVCTDVFDHDELDKISEAIKNRSDGWNVKFNFVNKIERTGAGKYKFIINKVKDVR